MQNKRENGRENLKYVNVRKNMGIGEGVSDPVSLDYEWVVTGDASTPIFCKFSLFSFPFCQRFLATIFLETMSMTQSDSCEHVGDGMMMSCFTKCAPTNFLVFMELVSISNNASDPIHMLGGLELDEEL